MRTEYLKIYHQLAVVFITLLISVSSSSAISRISLTQAIDKAEIAFDETVNFEIELRWSGSQAAYRFDRPLNPYFDRLKIERFSSSIESLGSGPDEITIKTFKYSLKPTSGGMGKIDPITINYASWPDSIPGELITEALVVNIAQPIIVEKADGLPMWVWILGGVLLVGVILAVIFRPWEKRDKGTVKPPNQTLLDGLDELKSESENNFKKFQTGLLHLIIDFLEKSYKINLVKFTAQEVDDALAKTTLSASEKEQLRGWVVKANEDKYKPLDSSPGDIIRLETEVRRFFENI